VDARRGAAAQGRTGVTFKDVAEDWYEAGKLKRDWSLNTQRDYRSVLDHHGIFEYAVRKHGLLSNPVKDVEKLRESMTRRALTSTRLERSASWLPRRATPRTACCISRLPSAACDAAS
jgi:hypothetical protein